MKPTAFFLNVGRGETVDVTALLDALRHRRIAGAGLDVFAKEPLPADSPLWDLPKDYVMPILIENMRLFLAGRYAAMRNRIAH